MVTNFKAAKTFEYTLALVKIGFAAGSEFVLLMCVQTCSPLFKEKDRSKISANQGEIICHHAVQQGTIFHPLRCPVLLAALNLVITASTFYHISFISFVRILQYSDTII